MSSVLVRAAEVWLYILHTDNAAQMSTSVESTLEPEVRIEQLGRDAWNRMIRAKVCWIAAVLLSEECCKRQSVSDFTQCRPIWEGSVKRVGLLH